MKSSAQPGADAEAALSQAMERLWERFLPEIKARIALLGAAAAAVAANTLTAPQCKEAQDAAHKLAGVLGTFNLARGTDLARELELTYSGENPPLPASGERLAEAAAELRVMVENRPSNS